MPRLGEEARRCLTRGALILLLSVTGAFAPARADITIHDDDGRAIALDARPTRIVALAPSATALLYAAGAGERIVATIEYADDPAPAARIPRIGDVQAIDFEQLVALRPDLVVVTAGITPEAMTERVAGLGFPVYRTRNDTLDDLPDSVRRLGRLAGTRTVAEASASRLEHQLAALRARYADRAPVSVLVQVWHRPIYTIGGRHVVTDALGICGARNIYADQDVAAPAVTVESVIERNPEIIIASGRTAQARGWLEDWRRFPGLAATASDRLLVFDDDRLTRMGPSAVSAAAALCTLIDGARARH